MFRDKEEIGKLIDLFTRRDVYLFHACQFKDFQSYLSLGGIPSRGAIEEHRLNYTIFDTDSSDKRYNIWNKVFVNLQDFGENFAFGHKAVPNPYGPILFKMRPESLQDAVEVTITLRSAGAKDFDREKEALTSIDEVDRIFLYSIHEKLSNLTKIKFEDRLYEAFPNRSPNHIKSPEVHCIFPGGFLPLKYAEQIIVDPYIIQDKPLLNWVNEEQRAKGFSIGLFMRTVNGQNRINKNSYNELLSIINISPYFDTLLQNSSPMLKNWAESIFSIDWQYERFAKYLLEGTLKPLLERLC